MQNMYCELCSKMSSNFDGLTKSSLHAAAITTCCRAIGPDGTIFIWGHVTA